jgi:molybdate transport system substrate-binding protein
MRRIGASGVPIEPVGANATVYFLDTTQTVDVFITYVTAAVQARAIDPTLQIVYLPRELLVPAPYGLTVLNGASSDGQKFAQYILSPQGQQILAGYGFTPSCRSWARSLSHSVCRGANDLER